VSTASAITIGLQLTTRSVPPVPLRDIDTGEAPAIWRGEDVDFRIGIFDRNGDPADLSGLSYLQLDIYPLLIPGPQPDTNQGYAPYSLQPYPTTPPAPLVSRTLTAGEITATITKAGWESGAQANGVLSLGWADTLSLELAGLPSKPFSLVVHGMTSAGRKLTFGGGPINVFEAGEQNIYLPNNVAPLDVPEATILYVQPNQQLLFSQTISVEGLIEIEGTLVQLA
jgi:hypothetical protein